MKFQSSLTNVITTLLTFTLVMYVLTYAYVCTRGDGPDDTPTVQCVHTCVCAGAYVHFDLFDQMFSHAEGNPL